MSTSKKRKNLNLVSDWYKKQPITIRGAIVGAVVVGVFTIIAAVLAAIIQPDVVVVLPTSVPSPIPISSPSPTSTPSREEDAIYQNGEIVALVSGVAIDHSQSKILFEEIYNSDPLNLESEFEFREWRLRFRRAETITLVRIPELHKGRIIENTECEILGTRAP